MNLSKINPLVLTHLIIYVLRLNSYLVKQYFSFPIKFWSAKEFYSTGMAIRVI